MKISHDSNVQLPYLFSYAFLVQRYTYWPEKVTCDQQPPFKSLNSIIGHFNFTMIMFSCLNHANFWENSYLEKKCWMLRFFFGIGYVIIIFMFSDMRWEVIARFVDLGGIIDHHCLNFIFIMLLKIYIVFYKTVSQLNLLQKILQVRPTDT